MKKQQGSYTLNSPDHYNFVTLSIHSYFRAFSEGKTHEESIDYIINTRYLCSKKDRKTVKEIYLSLEKFGDIKPVYRYLEESGTKKEWIELILLIHAISFFEEEGPLSILYHKSSFQISLTSRALNYIETIAF